MSENFPHFLAEDRERIQSIDFEPLTEYLVVRSYDAQNVRLRTSSLEEAEAYADKHNYDLLEVNYTWIQR